MKKTPKTAPAPTTTLERIPAAPAFALGDSGAGLEGADASSFAIPFLRVLQKLSPQCSPRDAAYIEGAVEGSLLNSVSGAVYSGETGVTFLPCAFTRRFVRWAPRGDQRSFIAEYTPEALQALLDSGECKSVDGRLLCADEAGRFQDKTSDKCIDTRNHFGLVEEPDGTVTQVLLVLTSTQIRKSKQLLSLLSSTKVRGPEGRLVTPPTWLNRIRLTTAFESNDQGSWFGVRFVADGFVTDEHTYAQGRSFHDSIRSGEAKVSHDSDSDPKAAAAAVPAGAF